MVDRKHDFGLFPQDAAMLEQSIHAAGDFMSPTQDLRAKVIADAQENERIMRHARRLALAGVICILLVSIGIPIMAMLDSVRNQMVAPGSAEIHRRAFVVSKDVQDGSNWGLVDSFQESRPVRAGILSGMRVP